MRHFIAQMWLALSRKRLNDGGRWRRFGSAFCLTFAISALAWVVPHAEGSKDNAGEPACGYAVQGQMRLTGGSPLRHVLVEASDDPPPTGATPSSGPVANRPVAASPSRATTNDGRLAASAADAAASAPKVVATVPTSSSDPVPVTAERVEYYHLDAIGSVRVVTGEAGAVLRRHDYLPFGEEWHEAGWVPDNPPTDKRMFTGQERDIETGMTVATACCGSRTPLCAQVHRRLTGERERP